MGVLGVALTKVVVLEMAEVPQPVTKEQGQWEPGCFVLHVPALSIEKRIEVLKEYSQYVVYE